MMGLHPTLRTKCITYINPLLMNKNQQSVQESNSQPELPIEIKLIPSLTEPLSDLALGNSFRNLHISKLKAEKNSCEHVILHLIYDFSEDIFQTLDDPTYNSSQTVILFFFFFTNYISTRIQLSVIQSGKTVQYNFPLFSELRDL